MVQNGHMAFPGPLARVSGGAQRVHGVSLDGHESSCEGLYGQNGLLERLGGSLEVLREGVWRFSEGAWGLLGRS